jgi:hypothetical protein
MTAIRFIQLLCEGCQTSVYPPLAPAPDMTAGELRASAAAVGWEVLRHTKGRDICPPCRVREINDAAATFVEIPGASR